MKIVKVKIFYNDLNKSINVKFDEDEYILLSDIKKTLNAQDIYNMFKYEIEKKYELEELGEISTLDDDNVSYLTQCYNIFKNIIDGIETPENEGK